MIHPGLFNTIYSYLDSIVLRYLSPDIKIEPIYRELNCNTYNGDIYYIGYYISQRIYNIEQVIYISMKTGYKNIIYEIIRRGYSKWNLIAYNASYNGHKDILDDMISRGVNNWNEIAYNAVLGENMDILNDMIHRGASTWYKIFTRSARDYNH